PDARRDRGSSVREGSYAPGDATAQTAVRGRVLCALLPRLGADGDARPPRAAAAAAPGDDHGRGAAQAARGAAGRAPPGSGRTGSRVASRGTLAPSGSADGLPSISSRSRHTRV